MRGGKRARLGTLAALAGASALLFGMAGCGIEFAQSEENLVAGKRLFVQRCGSCHILERAGTKGTSGPDLDESFQQSLRDGFERSTIEGMVHEQILYPNPRGVQAGPTPPDGERPPPRVIMPADLVTGDDARNVAAYVAYAAARPGKDTGALAQALPQAGGGEPIAAKNGKIDIPADPNGQLLFVTGQATAPAGPLTVSSTNESQVPHNIALRGPGVNVPPGPVVQGGKVSTLEEVDLKAGKYTFVCTVPGHEQAGMKGTLTVE